MREEFRSEIQGLHAGLATARAHTDRKFADLLKWSFAFWATMMAALLAQWGR